MQANYPIDRRELLKRSAKGIIGGSLATVGLASASQANTTSHSVVTNGRIRQSIMGWCFRDHMGAVTLAKHCKDIGLVAMEGISADHYPAIMEMGLEVSLVSGNHGFAKGPCNPEYHDLVVKGLIEGIDLAKKVGCQNVITFTGMRFEGMDDDKAAQRCIDTWKEVLPHAEKNGITLVLEHLNSRDDTQEINYPPILKEILKTGYTGYVAQEFIPNWDDPIAALRHAAKLCDV